MSTHAILFDLDETLFDHAHAARSSLAELRAGQGALQRRSLEELETEYGRLLDELHPLVLGGTLTMDGARWLRMERLFGFCGAVMPPEDVERSTALYRDAYQRTQRAMPGAIPLLERLHSQVTIGVVSNNLTEEQQDKLRSTGINHLIDLLVTSEDAGVEKPHPGIFHEALRRAGCAARDAVMVGDSWRADVLGAHSAGIRAVWLNRRGLPCPDLALATEGHGLRLLGW